MTLLPCDNQLRFTTDVRQSLLSWQGSSSSIAWDIVGIQTKFNTLDRPCYIVRQDGRIGVTNEGTLQEINEERTVAILTAVPPLIVRQLGDPTFLSTHGVNCANAAVFSQCERKNYLIVISVINPLKRFLRRNANNWSTKFLGKI